MIGRYNYANGSYTPIIGTMISMSTHSRKNYTEGTLKTNASLHGKKTSPADRFRQNGNLFPVQLVYILEINQDE